MNAKKGTKKFSYDIRQVDAWSETDPDGAGQLWTWNESWSLGTMETAGDPRQALPDYLKRHHGIRMKRGYFRIVYDGDIYEIQYRKSGRPIFAAIPNF